VKSTSLVLCMASTLLGATPWEILTQGAADENLAKRAQAVAAIGSIRTARADKLVEGALSDKESAVRLAAVNALAERKSRAAIPPLRAALEDESAEVSFTAARALWEMGDRGARDVLKQVLAGERKQSPGFLKQQVKDAKSTLRNPRKMAWMGAKEGAGFLFGPLGYGMGMVEGMTHDGSAPARALAATLLAQHRDLQAREDLEDALHDKSPLVRVAAAKALGGFADRSLLPKLQPLVDDRSEPARYMAAAAVVRIERARPAVKDKAKTD
jgi:HEAT repeat protein